MKLYRLENPVQRYAWGSADGLSACLGLPNPEGGPMAEMWMGAHPKAPSIALTEDGRKPLDGLIRAEPAAFLGQRAVEGFGPALPFLLKALSAAGPLSIQAHPEKRRAERGFERENLAGIPLDAPERNYRDPNHKPEMVMALTRFEGLFGFRPIDEIIGNIRLIAPTTFERYAGKLSRNPGRVELSVLFYSLVSSDPSSKADLIGRAAVMAARLLSGGQVPEGMEAAFRWMLRLSELYPGDIGCLAPIMLNYVALEPGEALYVPPGELHAYLHGESLELMANSDNVIRGALTSKHVDLPELLAVLTFDSRSPKPFRALPSAPGEEAFPVLAPDFRLSRLCPGGQEVARVPSGPEILLCASGHVRLSEAGGSVELGRGEAAFVRADCGRYSMTGDGVAYRAFLPEAGRAP
jgi:mannose-6-phosphate isomerase